jgi:PIN domain nuclease of toxin-antitoxin system
MTSAPLLLDSNILVWLDQKPKRFSASVVERIESASLVYLSAVTVLELSIKQALGSLTLARPVSDFIISNKMTELPVTTSTRRGGEELAPVSSRPV